MESTADSLPDEIMNEFKSEFTSRNRLLNDLNESYLVNAATFNDPASAHREYSSRRNELIWSSRRRIAELTRKHPSLAAAGRLAIVDQTLAAVPKEIGAPTAKAPNPANGQAIIPSSLPMPVGYQLVPTRSKISGRRVASGVLALVLSLWTSLTFAAIVSSYSYSVGVSEFMLFPAMWGSFICGIVIMAKSRSRGLGSAMTLIIFTGLGLLGYLTVTLQLSGIVPLVGILLSCSILILMIMDVIKVKNK